MSQLDLFAETPAYPPGFAYQRELIDAPTESELLARIRDLPFQHFDFHGHEGKRRTVSFGWGYSFEREAIEPAAPMPPFLEGLRTAAANFGRLPREALQQVLVTEYAAEAGIGWHRDKGVFGEIIGISLASPCSFRLRRRAGERWERVTVEAQPRSAYVLAGPARTEWEHSIPPVGALRYSVTFRTLRTDDRQKRPLP